ncbi:MAG: thioredoxin family protein [Candidatus Hodarchaeales archaeon]
MIERITETFFKRGMTFEEFIKEGTKDEQDRFKLYYRKAEKKFSSEEFKIDLENEVNLLLLATPWCWDSQTNVPILVRIAENSPKINLSIFNKDNYPFLIDKINGGEKVPQLLVFSADYYYLDRWVERSTKTYQLYGELRKELGWDTKEFVKEYRKRFLKVQKELEESLIQEIKDLLIRADAIQNATARLKKQSST